MTEATHTPGPWTFFAEGHIAHVTGEYESRPICDISGFDGEEARDYYYNRDAESTANARLIAAAPDLLNALVNLLAEVNRLGWGDSLETRDADAAIQKARGDA